MKKNILIVIFIVVGMILALKFNDHNRNKSISACLVAQKMESEKKDEKFDINKAKKLCEKIIKKK
tara:strand:- start:354 stop:548 length:195 start_codon:yes stop_codon:yes gene_type:complete